MKHVRTDTGRHLQPATTSNHNLPGRTPNLFFPYSCSGNDKTHCAYYASFITTLNTKSLQKFLCCLKQLNHTEFKDLPTRNCVEPWRSPVDYTSQVRRDTSPCNVTVASPVGITTGFLDSVHLTDPRPSLPSR